MFGRRKGLNFSTKDRKKMILDKIKDTGSLLIEMAIVIFLAYILVLFFGMRTTVIGSAMEPTLNAEDQILVNRFSFVIGKPHTNDVVIFLPNGNEKSHYYVRRIVGTPGDTVKIENGKLYVNDEEFEDVSDFGEIDSAGIASDTVTLGTDEYFVLGDNRNNSEDSRNANIGVVKKDYMIGKAWFVISGFLHFKVIR